MSEATPLGQETYNKRRMLLARSAIVALTTEGRSVDMDVRNQTLDALGVSPEDYFREMWKLDSEGRIEYGASGLSTTAGTLPETELEYKIRTQLIAPIAEHIDRINEVRLHAGQALSEHALQEVIAQNYFDEPDATGK